MIQVLLSQLHLQRVKRNFKSPFELWKVFFTEDLLETIVMQTNLYVNRDKNKDHICVDKEELLKFLGVLSGYHSLPGEQNYWSNQPDMGDSIVSKALSRKRFLSIKSKIHFVDSNTLDGSNKMAKIEPLYSTLNVSFIKHGIFHDRLSIDE